MMNLPLETILSWLLVLSLATLFVLVWIRDRKKKLSVFEKLGIPYIKPHLLFGSLHVLRANKGAQQLQIFDNWIKEYGKVFGFFFGWRPQLVVSDLDMIKTILIKDFKNFCNRPMPIFSSTQPIDNSIINLRDQRWRDVRATLMPTFSMVKLKALLTILDKKVDATLEIIRKKAIRNEPIECVSLYQGLTLDSINECVFAMETNCQMEGRDSLLISVRQYLCNAMNPAFYLAVCLPIFAYFLGLISNYFSKSGIVAKTIVENLQSVIEIRRKDVGQKNIDLLQLMLDNREQTQTNDKSDKGYQNGKNGHIASSPKKTFLSDDEIIANSWIFLLAGFETTSNCLIFTAYLLARHQDIQENLYNEICQIKEYEGGFTYQALSNMTYLDKVLQESLRLYPPVVSFTVREVKVDTRVNDIFIPKDTNVHIPVWSIHRNPEIWEDPEKFDPERFTPENKEGRHPMAHIPFGAGPRNCIGMRFALLEAKLAISRIIYHYRLDFCDETPPILKVDIPAVTMNPIEKILIKAVLRD